MDKSIFITGPDPKLELVYSDVWLPGLFSRRVLVFEIPPTSSHEKALAVLERALKALVEGMPELGGQSVVVPAAEHDGKIPWRAIKPYKGIELVIKDLTATFPSFAELERQNFPLTAFKDRLLMPIPPSIEPEPQPQSKFQASLIPGGLLLSTCIYHHLTDGNGMNAITRALADACNRASSSPGPLPPITLPTDRSTMSSLHGTQTSLSLHPAHQIIPAVYQPSSSPHSHSPPPAAVPTTEETPSTPYSAPPLPSTFTPALFHLSAQSASLLKSHASLPSPSPPISTHDAISALLWLTLTRARMSLNRISPTSPSIFTFPHNSRRHVGLPPNWVGNCVYFCLASAPLSTFSPSSSSPSALPLLASQIRAELNKVNHELVAGIMTVRRQDPWSLAWWPVGTPNDPGILGITSFYHSDLLGGDWGAELGRVRHFTTTDKGAFGGGLERTAFVGPKIGGEEGGEGGCEVLVGVDEEEAAWFARDEEWKRYFTEVGRGEA